MTNLAASLVQNLKDLNAKERDHLMRFAYLGATNKYEENKDFWLSKKMKAALKPQLSKTHLNSGRCVFAGMDYHLDWLYAALVRTYKGEEAGSLDDGSKCEDDSLRPVIGIQEDLDLLVVYADNQDRIVILCIEAKGVAPVNKTQLARKLVRLDRILVASGAKDRLQCRLVLIGPAGKAPESDSSCLEFVQSTRGGARHQEMCDYLNLLSTDIGSEKIKDVFVELKGFPTNLQRVVRTRLASPEANAKQPFTSWKITKR